MSFRKSNGTREPGGGFGVSSSKGGAGLAERRFETDCDHRKLYAWVIVGGQRVADLKAVNQGSGVMLLGSIEVRDDVVLLNSFASRMLRKIRPSYEFKSFRECGLGSRLILMLVEHCRDQGFNEIYGSVVQSDLDETPRLLSWYRKFGFEALPPDDRCLSGSVSMVVWKALKAPFR